MLTIYTSQTIPARTPYAISPLRVLSCVRNVKNRWEEEIRKDSLVGELKTKTTVNQAQCYDCASKPDVSMRPEGTALVFLEKTMVNESEKGLEEYEDEQNDSNDRVGIIEL
jgi:hypothetical protein